MRELYYSSGHMLVADITASTVMAYARALADTGKADIVTVPIIQGDGSVADAHLLVGPSSQLFDVPVPGSSQEPIDSEALEAIERKTRALLPRIPASRQGETPENRWEPEGTGAL